MSNAYIYIYRQKPPEFHDYLLPRYTVHLTVFPPLLRQREEKKKNYQSFTRNAYTRSKMLSEKTNDNVSDIGTNISGGKAVRIDGIKISRNQKKKKRARGFIKSNSAFPAYRSESQRTIKSLWGRICTDFKPRALCVVNIISAADPIESKR